MYTVLVQNSPETQDLTVCQTEIDSTMTHQPRERKFTRVIVSVKQNIRNCLLLATHAQIWSCGLKTAGCMT